MKLAPVCCSSCREVLVGTDLITIDFLNTLTHQICKSTYPVIDEGTYEEIAARHRYFYMGEVVYVDFKKRIWEKD